MLVLNANQKTFVCKLPRKLIILCDFPTVGISILILKKFFLRVILSFFLLKLQEVTTITQKSVFIKLMQTVALYLFTEKDSRS